MFYKAMTLSGERSNRPNSQRAYFAGLLIDVLIRLGGAFQVGQQPAFVKEL